MKHKILQVLASDAVFGAMATTGLQGTAAQADTYKHPYSVNHRETRQQRRIYQGISRGALTNRETRHLEAREASIHHAEARARRSGGKFTWRERINIQKRENRASHAIYQQKHDRQHR